MATEMATREATSPGQGRDWEALYRAHGRQPAAYLEPEPHPFDADEEEWPDGGDYGRQFRRHDVGGGGW